MSSFFSGFANAATKGVTAYDEQATANQRAILIEKARRAAEARLERQDKRAMLMDDSTLATQALAREANAREMGNVPTSELPAMTTLQGPERSGVGLNLPSPSMMQSAVSRGRRGPERTINGESFTLDRTATPEARRQREVQDRTAERGVDAETRRREQEALFAHQKEMNDADNKGMREARKTASADLAFQRMSTRANPLASSFQRETERHQVVAESLTTLNGLRESALNGDGAAQHMLVFSLMKLADPGSAVRQDERADTKNAANVPEQLRAAWNRGFGGGGTMSRQTVEDFLATADSTQSARIKDFDTIREQHNRRAKLMQVDSDLVTSDYFAALRTPPPSGAPSSGATHLPSAAHRGPRPISQAEFNKLKPESQKAALAAGYTIVP